MKSLKFFQLIKKRGIFQVKFHLFFFFKHCKLLFERFSLQLTLFRFSVFFTKHWKFPMVENKREKFRNNISFFFVGFFFLWMKTLYRCNSPTSDRVLIQFSTLNRWPALSQAHSDTLNAACSNCTKIGCLVWQMKNSTNFCSINSNRRKRMTFQKKHLQKVKQYVWDKLFCTK